MTSRCDVDNVSGEDQRGFARLNDLQRIGDIAIIFRPHHQRPLRDAFVSAYRVLITTYEHCTYLEQIAKSVEIANYQRILKQPLKFFRGSGDASHDEQLRDVSPQRSPFRDMAALLWATVALTFIALLG